MSLRARAQRRALASEPVAARRRGGRRAVVLALVAAVGGAYVLALAVAHAHQRAALASDAAPRGAAPRGAAAPFVLPPPVPWVAAARGGVGAPTPAPSPPPQAAALDVSALLAELQAAPNEAFRDAAPAPKSFRQQRPSAMLCCPVPTWCGFQCRIAQGAIGVSAGNDHARLAWCEVLANLQLCW